MPPLRNSRTVQLFGRRRRCSSFPDEIPTAETRRRRQQTGLAPATGAAIRPARRRPCAGRSHVRRRPPGRQERNALTVDEVNVMDLVTLVTACALAVDPKIMDALIWHQSGGEPWSFTMPGERQPQVYQNVRDAVRAARAVDRDDIAIRVGLTDLSAVLDQRRRRCSRRAQTLPSRRGRSRSSASAARPLGA